MQVTQEQGIEKLTQLADFITNADGPKGSSLGMGPDILKLYGIWSRKNDRIEGETFSEYVSPLLDKFIKIYLEATDKALQGLHVPTNCPIVELAHNTIPQAAKRLVGTDRTPSMLRKVYKENNRFLGSTLASENKKVA